MKLKFRLLEANEIDVRLATVSEKGVSLLLYKDARCDMNILDETVGAMNWQRNHARDNANCIVSIWDDEKKQWISKEDTGTESFTEKEKGLASDSFKRACFNWGIGRELYTAPFIWVSADKVKIEERNGKKVCNERFRVSKIGYDDRRTINELVINGKKGVVFEFNNSPHEDFTTRESASEEMLTEIRQLIEKTNSDFIKMCTYFKVQAIEEMTPAQANKCIEMLKSKL